jgi:hypothetical protein
MKSITLSKHTVISMMKRSLLLKILIFFCASGLFSCASTYNFEKLSRLVESNCYGGSSFRMVYLNFIDTDGEAPKSMRSEVLQKWRTLGVFVDIKSKDMPALQENFFGEGGVYSSRELELRASMYDQVSTKINLMMQDLNYLIIEFGKMQNKYRG